MKTNSKSSKIQGPDIYLGADESPILDARDARPGFFRLANEAIFAPVRMRGAEILALANSDRAAGRALTNEERFTAAYYSEPLTQYATGWTDSEDLTALLNFVAPRVPVGRRFEFKSAVNAEAFLSEGDDYRAIGAEFKRIEYTGTTVNSKTDNHGLTYRLDLDEEGAGILTEELIISRILQRLKRNIYRRAITALLASCNNTAVTWSTGATPQPNENIRSALLRGLTSSGLVPNRLLFDFQAWAYRGQGLAPQALNAGAISAYLQTPQQVGDFLGMSGGAMISRAVYQSSATAKTLITAGKVIAFIGQDAPSRDDPTNVKNFVTPVGDGDFRVYRIPYGAKFVDLTVEYYNQIVGTATVGAESLTVS